MLVLQSTNFVQRVAELRESGLCDDLLRRVAASKPSCEKILSLLHFTTF